MVVCKDPKREAEIRRERSERMKRNNPSRRSDIREDRSRRMKGSNNPFYGKTHTPEVIELIRVANTGPNSHQYGVPRPLEVREKIRRSHTGVPKSQEHRKHLSESRVGMRPSEYTRKLLREFQLEKWQRPGFKDRMRQAHMGERCHWWKGGVTPVYFQIRGSTKYDDWRRAVFKRDDYRDWYSGLKGSGNLNAHHVIPLNVLIKKYRIKTLDDALRCDALWDVNNGVTMFNTTHLAHHAMWGDD